MKRTVYTRIRKTKMCVSVCVRVCVHLAPLEKTKENKNDDQPRAARVSGTEIWS